MAHAPAHRPFAIDVDDDVIAAYWHESHIPSSRGVMVLPGFTGDSVGPARLFVEFGAAAAAAGWHVLRIDFRGRGISPGDAERTDLRSMERDARAAVEAFRRKAGLRRVVVAGLCLGCVVALSLASTGCVEGFVFWSPEPIGVADSWRRRWERLAHQLRIYARKATTLETWRRVLRAELNAAGVGTVLARAVIPKAGRTAVPIDERGLRSVRAQLQDSARTPMLCVLAREDPEARSSAESYRAGGNAARSIVWIEAADHNFLPSRSRAEVIRESLAFLDGLEAHAADRAVASAVY